MTTTEPTESQHRDIYSLLEELPLVAEMSEGTRGWIDEVRKVTDEVRATILHAKDVWAMHEAHASIVLERIKATVPGLSDELDDGLYELAGILSGSRELHGALEELSQLADPDTGCRTLIDEARERVENGAAAD